MAMKYFLFTALLTLIVAVCRAEDKADSKANQKDSFWESVADFFLPHKEKRNLLFEKQTLYFLVTVEEDSKGWRHLVFNPNKGSQGIWNPESPDDLISNYCKYTAIFLTAINAPPKKALFIGLGAGIMPRFLRKQFPETKIDIVELDGGIPEIAEKYFGFKKDMGTNISIGDGRDFINRTHEKYDLIFIDAYTAEKIPFQLTTEEFYVKIRNALSPGGIMTANIANIGKENFVSSEIKTVGTVFPNLAVFVCGNKSSYILFSTADKKLENTELKDGAQKIERKISFKLGELIDTRMQEDEIMEMTKDAIILKDDFAPVETMD